MKLYRCRECGRTFQPAPTGRPPAFCGGTCRVRAFRKRRGAYGPDTLHGVAGVEPANS